MWAAALHLVAGNAVIGVAEGLAFARLLRIPKRRSIAVMTVANYASAWVGGMVVSMMIVEGLSLDLNNAWQWFWALVGLTYVLTLLVEWPFVIWLLRGSGFTLRRSVTSSLQVQTASYVILFGWYWSASATSIYTKWIVVDAKDIRVPENVSVYYIGHRDGHVYKRTLSGGGPELVLALGSQSKEDRVFIRPNQSDTNRWDVVARVEGEKDREAEFIPVLTNCMVEAAVDSRSLWTDPPTYEGTWWVFGDVPKIAEATNSNWDIWTGFWPTEGMRVGKKATSEFERFAYETPFGSWPVRNAVHLPSDVVLFQLGTDQICLLDLASPKGWTPLAWKRTSGDYPQGPYWPENRETLKASVGHPV